MAYALRTTGDPLAYVNSVREVVRQADGRVPVSDVRTQRAEIEDDTHQEITLADLCSAFVGLKSVAEQGLAMLGVGGGLYLVGVARPDVEISVNIVAAIGGQKRVQGVNFGSTNFKRDIPMYAELYLQGRMNLDDLFSRRISLRDVNEGYAALKDGSLTRVVVTSF